MLDPVLELNPTNDLGQAVFAVEFAPHTPFAAGGYEIAALSAGLAIEAVDAVATGGWKHIPQGRPEP